MTTDTPNAPPLSHLERLWHAGQRYLAAGRYVAARRELEAAEAVAWRTHDAATLARLTLPLTEARRQIRHTAADGTLVVSTGEARDEARQLAAFLRADAGTFLFACHSADVACRSAGSVQYASRHRGSCIEALLLMTHHGETRLVSLADPHFVAGLPVTFTQDPAAPIDPDALARGAGKVPLPPPGVYDPTNPAARALHARARESLLIAWEALALRWQSRHPLRPAAPSPEAAWEELAWLRLTLRVDPACEPAAMRLMALAEAVERRA